MREARGEDPDDLHVVLEEVAEDFDKMLVELRRLASEEGINLDAPLPPVPIVLDAVRLRVAGYALVANAGQLSHRPGDEFATTALIIAMKAARIAGHLSDMEECEAWEADAVPNLLLLESLLEALRHGLAGVRDSPPDDGAVRATVRALTDLNRILDPLVAAVGEQPRRLLARLVGRGAAPSPFCDLDIDRPSDG